MKYSYRLIALMAAAFAAVPLSAQSTQGGERARAAANSATEMPVIIPAGTPLTVAIDPPVKGTVAHVARRSAGGNPGSVTLSVTSVRAVDGTYVPLRGTTKAVGKKRQGQAAALGILTFGIGATKKGLSAVIPAGTQFTVFTNAKRTVVVPR